MNNVIEHSLKMTAKKIKTNNFKVWRVLILMGTGEAIILLLWAIVAPLQYKRSCITYQEGGVWDGACLESLGKCRTTQGPAFVALLSTFHVGCVLAGMYMCYLVRNLPSIMAEGKWVFTGFYSQLQVFVTAVPVLIMVKDDYISFTILKSLVICAGDLTTLAMVFFPKMLLVTKYYDFEPLKVSQYVAKTMSESTQKDTVYEQLRVSTRGSKKSGDDDSAYAASSGTSEGGGDSSSSSSKYVSETTRVE